VVRVLIIAPAPLGESRIGGIANFIRGFVHHMPADFQVEICGVSVGDEPHDGRWHLVELSGREVRFLSVAHSDTSRRSGRIPMKARVVWGIFRRRRRLPTNGRVIQVHAPGMDYAFAGRKAPLVRVVHNAPEDLATAQGESLWRRFGPSLGLVERLTFRRAARVYFVNRATYEQYAARQKPGNAKGKAELAFLPNFVETDLFKPLPPEDRLAARQRLAPQLGVAAESPWILFAGRIDHQKDPLLAIHAFAALPRDGRAGSSRLLLAGEGVLRADAEKLAGDLGVNDRVSFLGNWPHDELATLMAASDVFLLTSAFEAGPTVLYEALAAGLPAVSTSVGEAPRLIRDRETGWLAPDFAPESLATGLEWALNLDRDAVAGACAASMAPYDIRAVLAPFYEDHRRLVSASADSSATDAVASAEAASAEAAPAEVAQGASPERPR